MKNLFVLALAFVALISCKKDTTKTDYSKEKLEVMKGQLRLCILENL